MDAHGEDVGKKMELVSPYSVYRKSLSWADAAIFCEKHEGHLATFVNIEDAKKVIEKIYAISEKVSSEYLSGAKTAEFGLDRRYWMALTDLVSGEGNWVWAGKGAPLTYNLWYPGQPDHIDKNGNYIGRPEHCGALWNPIFHKGDRRHSFVDQECKRQYYFICETNPDKLKKQKEWDEANKNKQPSGKSVSMLLFQRGREHHDSHSELEQNPMSKGRGIILHGNGRSANMLERSNDKTEGKSAEKWTGEDGFKELFEASQSSSIEDASKYVLVTKSKDKSASQEEVSDVFSL
jgi:hypothetical protein